MAAPLNPPVVNQQCQPQQSNGNGATPNLRGCHPCIAQKGSCRYGENCKFAKISANACLIHLQHQANANKPACKFGAQCRHSHIHFDASRTPYEVSKRQYLRQKQQEYRAKKQSAYTYSDSTYDGGYSSGDDHAVFRHYERKQKARKSKPRPSYHHKLNSTWHLKKDGTVGMNPW